MKYFTLLTISVLAIALVLSGCGNPASADNETATLPPTLTAVPATSTATATPLPTDTPVPTATIVRTPPAIQPIFQPTTLNPLDYPHTYINNACEYLKLKWDPNNAAPGTVVMVIMFHSIQKDGEIGYDDIGAGEFRTMMTTLKDQGFEAINATQLADFLETNAQIPERSVVLLVDDRHFAQYYDTYFREYYEQWGWQVVNAWISYPENTLGTLWGEMEALNQEGLIDFQAHGVVHNIVATENSTDEFLLNEFNGSIEFIQEHFGTTPIAYIWPGGNFTPRAAELARQSGYRIGFTVNPRGPIMFNWIPIADQKDNARPAWLAEGPVNDPLMVLPRYWPSQVMSEIDNVRVIGKQAATYAEEQKSAELEYYDIVCSPSMGALPSLEP